MSLLSVVQAACRRLSLDLPSVVVSSTDPIIQQMRGMADEMGREAARSHAWTALTREQTFTTVAAETQPGVIPADFDRFVNESWWNRTQQRPLRGPLSAEQWQREKATVTSVVFDAFRLRGGAFLMRPTPTAGHTIAFEYVSTHWVDTDADGTGDASAYAADTDAAVLSEELLTLAVIWRWRQAKGLDYAEELANYDRMLADLKARDGGRETICMSGPAPFTVRRPGVPEGTWNL